MGGTPKTSLNNKRSVRGPHLSPYGYGPTFANSCVTDSLFWRRQNKHICYSGIGSSGPPPSPTRLTLLVVCSVCTYILHFSVRSRPHYKLNNIVVGTSVLAQSFCLCGGAIGGCGCALRQRSKDIATHSSVTSSKAAALRWAYVWMWFPTIHCR